MQDRHWQRLDGWYQQQGEHDMKKTFGLAMIVIVWCALAAGGAEPSAPPAVQPSSQPAKDLTLDLGNNVTMKLVLIPAGKFMMGSPEDEKDRLPDENPHEVTITKPYYMGVFSVTQAQWTAVMGAGPWKGKDYVKEEATCPATFISWDDAAEFCGKFSKTAGRNVRLPTEAQWEYACRAGSKTRFYYGDDPDYSKLGDYAWYSKNAADGGEKYAHPVGLKKPNDWGLYDMHGNVWQWCSNWYEGSYAHAKETDPQGLATGTNRVLRGGSWIYIPRSCRSAIRYGTDPLLRICSIGFRVVVELD